MTMETLGKGNTQQTQVKKTLDDLASLRAQLGDSASSEELREIKTKEEKAKSQLTVKN